jgi:hypothetical protein
VESVWGKALEGYFEQLVTPASGRQTQALVAHAAFLSSMGRIVQKELFFRRRRD